MSFDFGVLERLWLMSIEEALTSIKLGRGEPPLRDCILPLLCRDRRRHLPAAVGLGEETAWQEVGRARRRP